MNYYSTNGQAPMATLKKAVQKGLAEDRGLYMPQRLPSLSALFLDGMKDMSLQEIGFQVAKAFFGQDVEEEALRRIVDETLCFPIPLRQVEKNIFALELFHGPTLAFKDVGARFMARMLQYFRNAEGDERTVNVLVATSGDTGSAVANGFLGVEGVRVFVLYPKGGVSPIQECQFTTLGQNITAIEVDGVFDDCQALVKSAFMDSELNERMVLTSANSINVARFLPQSFYYFHAIAQLQQMGYNIDEAVCCVPSGNFGNLCSALFGRRMGLPMKRFIAANNENDTFFRYLQSGEYDPRHSVATIANAMDVGDPSNFVRIYDLYGKDVEAIRQDITAYRYSDEQIAETMCRCLADTGYVLDPHGACGYRALKESLRDGEVGFFLETAHPAKFHDTVRQITKHSVPIPERLSAFMQGTKQSIACSREFSDFKQLLIDNA